ncbi:DUF1990 domain-containing protein [Paractinoplanes deccanensis]|uniref:DUF1990 domain-containing protein n=1 Tax=Paractinoplanes deccanensis TaxID=113561 RepID=A0ABQ3YKZ1_9ACTN|nr:DUF1990 domain-containing protein [Actinoplanes deccanensis]GID80460.1 DUF1990 domain-containing protein [Actinoplanes deccanensis]
MALTYPEVGATRDEPLPGGYGHVRRDVRVGDGRAAFEAAADGILRWEMHRAAGFAVSAGADRAAPGVTVTLRAGWGPVRLTIPCLVVYTIEEENRRGFAYGTLPGHPERGEEAFAVELTDAVYVRIRAFSRPASLLARAGGPVSRLVQEHVTDRYVEAVRRLASPPGRSPAG